MKSKLVLELLGRYTGQTHPPAGEIPAAVARAFSHVPYENLSKFLNMSEQGPEHPILRMGEQVLSEHLDLGLGGTCFSLTQACHEVLAWFGIESRRVTGSMKAGRDIHSAVVIPESDGSFLLIDPGYLVPMPLRIQKNVEARTLFAGREYRLVPREGRVDLYLDGKWKLTLNLDDMTEERFFESWHHSFQTMKDLLITMRRGDELLYLRNNFFRVTREEGVTQRRLKDDMIDAVSAFFSLPPRIVQEAVSRYRETHPWKKLPKTG